MGRDPDAERLRRRARRPGERAARRDFLDDLRRAACCARCGFADFRALDFHHRDPALKKFEVGRAIRSRRTWAQIEAEIAKCDMLCANCHRIEHHENPVAVPAVAQSPAQLSLVA